MPGGVAGVQPMMAAPYADRVGSWTLSGFPGQLLEQYSFESSANFVDDVLRHSFPQTYICVHANRAI